MKIRSLLLFAALLSLWESAAYGSGEKNTLEPGAWAQKSFVYVAEKFGIPILRASIRIANGLSEGGRDLYRVQASVNSLNHLGFLFRMNNRFTSTMESETCVPVRYVKEIDQEGLLVPNKRYLQEIIFDFPNKRVIVENGGGKARQEIPLPPDTYDPLSMFARCYLKEELHPGQDIRMSIYDGVKLRQMVFQSRRERMKSRIYGAVEVLRLESSTSFSAFGDKEGVIRIWYTADGKKIPVLMELDLPVGSVKFELEKVEES